MKAEIISIEKRMLDGLHRLSVVYVKNGIKHKLDMLTEKELTETEIQNELDYEN